MLMLGKVYSVAFEFVTRKSPLSTETLILNFGARIEVL